MKYNWVCYNCTFKMVEQGGFFDVEITDNFVSDLDDLTYGELITILRDHFNN